MLKRTLNKSLRAVLNKSQRENVSNMLRELGYLSMEKETQRDILTFVFRLGNKLYPDYLSNLVSINNKVHQYETMHANKFHVQKRSARERNWIIKITKVKFNKICLIKMHFKYDT